MLRDDVNKARKIKCLKTISNVLKRDFVKNLLNTTTSRYEYEQEVQLMKTLIQHILRNFPSNSYMDRYTFVFQVVSGIGTLKFVEGLEHLGLGRLDVAQLIKESFTSQAKP